MSVWNFRSRLRPRHDVPAEIYISIVDSLYSDTRSLFMGAIAVSLAILVTAVNAGEPLLYFCAAAVAAVAGGRALGVSAYHRQRPEMKTAQDAGRWEFQYAIGTSAQIALLGIWCVVAFGMTTSPFVQLVSITSTVAYLIGVTGRNFGSSRLVVVQILCAAPLTVLSLWLTGDVYYAIYSVLFVSFFFAMKFISDRLRKTLMDAVIAARDNTLLANRFDAALNNMPLGLCMFDAERRLVVINHRGMELLGVPGGEACQGASALDLFQAASRAGVFTLANASRIVAEIENGPTGRGDDDIEVVAESGRTFALTFQPMANRGSVVMIEEISER
jgi:PAS domain-containing protein